jgi:fatty acid amide hydrolase 2
VYIDRIKEVNPLINCVVNTCFDEALAEAKQVDRILSKRVLPAEYSAHKKPLLGVPFSCKESFQAKGMPNSAGVIARKHLRSAEDANVVRYMREAGAILTCMTNTSEACMWLESHNYLYGVTNNPYNLSRYMFVDYVNRRI